MVNEDFNNWLDAHKSNHQEESDLEMPVAAVSDNLSNSTYQESNKKKTSRKRNTLQEVTSKIKQLTAIPVKERTDLQKAELKGLKGLRKELEGRKIRNESRKEQDLARHKELIRILKANQLDLPNELQNIIRYAKEHGYQHG